MNKEIKITIVTVCYNSKHLIENTIKSVISQNYNNYEYIIIDGASTDGTIDVIEQYRDRVDFYSSEKDLGISDAFNKGIKASKGDLICFLNAGDYFLDNNVLSKVSTDWKNDVDILFYQMRVGKDGITPPKKLNDNEQKIWEELEVPHQSCFCKRSLFEELGYFNVGIRIRMDFDFFARCKLFNKNYKYIPEIITQYDDNGVSANINNRIRFAEEALYIKKLYGLKVTIKDYLRVLKWRIAVFFKGEHKCQERE